MQPFIPFISHLILEVYTTVSVSSHLKIRHWFGHSGTGLLLRSSSNIMRQFSVEVRSSSSAVVFQFFGKARLLVRSLSSDSIFHQDLALLVQLVWFGNCKITLTGANAFPRIFWCGRQKLLYDHILFFICHAMTFNLSSPCSSNQLMAEYLATVTQTL